MNAQRRLGALFATTLCLVGCTGVVQLSQDSPDAGAPSDARGPDTSAPADAAAGSALEVQEWGTFTSVQASDGHTLGGVHHEDETLPTFVHRRNWNDRNNYYFEQLPEEPLQQLETPVLYFWSQQAQAVEVNIDFPEGVVGQWYPEASAYQPELGACRKIGGGSMTWNITVDPAVSAITFPKVDPDEVWAPSRHVASTPVSRWGENEQFIFYRGLGKFDPPVRVVEIEGGNMRVSNRSADDLAAVFVLRVTDGGGAIIPLGRLAAGETRALAVPLGLSGQDAYVADARAYLREALVASGLAPDVAQAMVDTWTRSWFKNVGLRVLYLAPRPWADAWLPTRITPAPASFVRTLVGRIETLRVEEERSLVEQIQANAPRDTPIDPASLGRFAEPRIRRALEALIDPGEHAYTRALLDEAHALP